MFESVSSRFSCDRRQTGLIRNSRTVIDQFRRVNEFESVIESFGTNLDDGSSLVAKLTMRVGAYEATP